MDFGTPTSIVSDDGTTTPPAVNLTYNGVGLRIAPGYAALFVRRDDGSTRTFRHMEHVTSIELDWDGSLLIQGMEARSDHALISATWTAAPHYPTREESEAHEALEKELDELFDPDPQGE